jgi:putative ABC transport system ATP-binding protein
MITISNLSKEYQTGETSIYALNSVDLEIKEGQMVAIVGDSGSGKSTLMNILGCIDIQSSGDYYLDGVLVKNLNEKQLCNIRNEKIGFIFQSFNLIPELTAFENVELPLIYMGVPKEERKIKVAQAIELMGISNRESHFPNQLSGGQMQRVAIARAIVTNPQIILADEPTGNLDSKSSKKIIEILENLNNQGKTVVIITHSHEIARSAQRILQINDGKLTTIAVNSF